MLRGFPLAFCNGGRVPKTRMMSLPEDQRKCDDMSVRLDTVPALGRQTDGRTVLVKQYLALRALHADTR